MSVVFAVGDALEFDSQFRGFQACVSDFPAGISFMNRKWDGAKGGRDEWIRYWAARARTARNACERGAYGLFWAMPRTTGWTQHALEDAGWEPVDVITHHFGQGRPKGAGALKPASEHWHLVRNGGSEPLQIDACRVPRNQGASTDTTGGSFPTNATLQHHSRCLIVGTRRVRGGVAREVTGERRGQVRNAPAISLGRDCGFVSDDGMESIPLFNCLAGCDCGESSLAPSTFGEPPACPSCGAARWWACPAAEIDRQSGERTSGLMRAGTQRTTGGGYNGFGPQAVHADTYADSGGASRFFPQFYYAAKSPSRERHAGCHDLFWERDDDNLFGYRQVSRERYAALPADRRALGNAHSTVKAIGSRKRPGIARWLVRLITPPGGRVCDVTCGSGSIPIAAHLEGFDAVGMDICPEAIVISQHRAAYWEAERLNDTRREEARI